MVMDENRARRVVDALRDRGVPAHMAQASAGRSETGVRVVLPGEREALWDTDGTAGLEAQVMRDGMLVGFVPRSRAPRTSPRPRSSTRSPTPTTTSRSPAGPPGRCRPAPALPREGGFFRRMRDGFRER